MGDRLQNPGHSHIIISGWNHKQWAGDDTEQCRYLEGGLEGPHLQQLLLHSGLHAWIHHVPTSEENVLDQGILNSLWVPRRQRKDAPAWLLEYTVDRPGKVSSWYSSQLISVCVTN